MTAVREIMKQSIELASADKLEEALSILDDGINEALKENHPSSIVRLSKHAGVICDGGMNDLARAKRYYELALKYESDPYLHLALGDVYQKLSESGLAKVHYDACYDLASEMNDSDLIGIVEKKRAESR